MRANTVLGEAVTPIWGEEMFVLWFAVALSLSLLRIMKLPYSFLFHFIMASACPCLRLMSERSRPAKKDLDPAAVGASKAQLFQATAWLSGAAASLSPLFRLTFVPREHCGD